MTKCFGCDNITCICSAEELEWAIKNDPEGYERHQQAADEGYYGDDEH